MGYLPEEMKPAYFKMADIFVLPSLRDPWGLTINEAMICEKPIITTWDVGAKELVRDNGIVVPSGDEKRLYEAMACMLADEARLREMGLKSWEYVQEYSIEKEAEAFLAAISYVKRLER
jgi:glycosyltransferase involved in cell wall biosynthesis